MGGIWRVTMPGGYDVTTRLEDNVVYDVTTRLEDNVVYDMADLRGVVAPVGSVLQTLAVPDTIPDGHLLTRAGGSLVGVDPGALAGSFAIPPAIADGDLLAKSGPRWSGWTRHPSGVAVVGRQWFRTSHRRR